MKRAWKPQIDTLIKRLLKQGYKIESIQQMLREAADELND